ncbi:acyl-CoA carboxylase epsilon subunit [Streptomyces sp. JJ36]|uniref:acyl-CoA carboxylase epsilon subunit n=1 Tax=Streptomyces sp. JJ36 TaxID=2736645 RepID=UPI001F2E8F94|nr:acyl-CoA carboxylase epsilon subunit [Streptomyces sp. JJ36]MCF6526499.1 acyl-CoA carboxylase subunit epsilon [Streptomyces sp. JJ36]
MTTRSTGSTGSAPAGGAATLVRVERGHASDEELAALTALLLARTTSTPHTNSGHATGTPRKAPWRRLERTRGFPAPHSWQH